MDSTIEVSNHLDLVLLAKFAAEERHRYARANDNNEQILAKGAVVLHASASLARLPEKSSKHRLWCVLADMAAP